MRRPMTRGIWLVVCCGLAGLCGCTLWQTSDVRSQSPDDDESAQAHTRLVGDLAVPYGMFPVKVVAVGLVTGLHGTGSDPPPSAYRAALIDEMQTRGVPNPNSVLASPDTAMVLIRGVLRRGIQKNERFDVEVRIHGRSETTSLRGGHLLQARLTEMAVLNNRIHEGHLLAMAEGPVMVDPAADGKGDRVMSTRGRILGGGVALKSRPLGLVLREGHQSVMASSRVEQAVNKRFHMFSKGIKTGVAKAKTDQFIELAVHPKHKDNVNRYVQVVRAVALRESATQRTQRIARLKDRLFDPVSSAAAALELEAIGTEGVEALKQGIKQRDLEVRFYSAEALAYLGEREAAGPLGEAARREPAFRVFALTALSAMDDFTACEQLRELLAAPSAETRYGAFRALWTMNPADPLIVGESMGGQFNYHVLDVAGPDMIHVTGSRRPEVVLFGQDQRLLAPLAVNAGNQIMISAASSDEISVSKFGVGEPDQKRVVSTRVDDVVRAVVELGGTYPDVVQALQEAKAAGALTSRFQVDALPTAGRSFDRVARADGRATGGQGSPLPDLFSNRAGKKPSARGGTAVESEKTGTEARKSTEQKHRSGGFLARMIGRESN